MSNSVKVSLHFKSGTTLISPVCSFPLHIGHSHGPVITLGMESTNLVISQKVSMTQKT